MQAEKTQAVLEEIIDAVIDANKKFGITLQEMHEDVVRACQALHEAHPQFFGEYPSVSGECAAPHEDSAA